MNQIEVSTEALLLDPTQIGTFTKGLDTIQTDLDQIFNCFDLYQQALGASETEPKPGKDVQAPNHQFFSYGVTGSHLVRAQLTTTTQHKVTGHGIGHNRANFTRGGATARA